MGMLSGDESQRAPSWAPDGNSLVYVSSRSQQDGLALVRLGANPRIVWRGAAENPRWSPRGDWVLFATNQGLNLVSVATGGQRKLAPGRWVAHTWSRTGSEVFGLRDGEEGLELTAVNVLSRRPRVVSKLGPLPASFSYSAATGASSIQGFSLAPDGRTVTTSFLRAESDIWLLEGFNRKLGFFERYLPGSRRPEQRQE
jgi:hypothetical protein